MASFNPLVGSANFLFLQETLRESNEEMHCDGRLHQYKTFSRSVTLNNQMSVFVNPIGLTMLFYSNAGLCCDHALFNIIP